MPPSAVLDSSALLAVFFREPGESVVLPMLDGAAISAVNWSEVVQKATERGAEPAWLRAQVLQGGVSIIPFEASTAEVAAGLRSATLSAGLSLGDRACLALATELGVSALTADRAWTGLPIDCAIVVIR